ncbi:MAG: response regulator transcription factor [Burkholderiaceae bacterium]
MKHLTRNDFSAAFEVLRQLESQSGDATSFARHGVVALTGLVASELTTLSVCNLRTGRRQVVGLPGTALSAADIEASDQHFFAHPLVRFHRAAGRQTVHRISDSLTARAFGRTALYADYYRRIGIHHAMAVPIYMNGLSLFSFVLNRSRRDFGERQRECLELMRPHLAYLYRQACAQTRASHVSGACELPSSPTDGASMLPALRPLVNAMGPGSGTAARLRSALFDGLAALTPRERDVLIWLARGKTDRDIATVLALSPRTVQKHLEHIYVKLGVETRTAAVMRVFHAGDRADIRAGASP